MSEQTNANVGSALIGAGAGNGVTDFLTSNAHLFSLAFTILSGTAGMVFLYLNWKENKRRVDILEAQYLEARDRIE